MRIQISEYLGGPVFLEFSSYLMRVQKFLAAQPFLIQWEIKSFRLLLPYPIMDILRMTPKFSGYLERLKHGVDNPKANVSLQ